jgi:UDPglucose 6-dehydrogenase
MDKAKEELTFDNIQFCQNALRATEKADVLILLTEWPEFNEIDLGEVKKRMRNCCILDGRNHLDEEKAKLLGFYYEGIGKKL